MVYLPIPLILFVLFFFLLPFIWLTLAIDVVEVATAKLGFSPEASLALLLGILVGSTINIPLYRQQSETEVATDLMDIFQREFWGIPLPTVKQTKVVALNVGGGLISALLALYQFGQASPAAIVVNTAIVTTVSYFAARVVPGIGIQMNPLLAPITAAVVATLFPGGDAPAVAFAGGILGTILGADLLHLRDLSSMKSGVLSIGGAGVFDGILLCGLFALLLT